MNKNFHSFTKSFDPFHPPLSAQDEKGRSFSLILKFLHAKVLFYIMIYFVKYDSYNSDPIALFYCIGV